MNNEIIVKALTKILKEQKEMKEDLTYLIDAVNLLLDIQKEKNNLKE